ncbi:MAG: glycosyltransferase [Candidatus Micrarchaeota archaeon]|nr:glycosyltransferase [Candidatus Micrarchaeota archaeon]MCX8154342.1 glycosyltransferase [Candidatus Micrarchaeota archaeon]
MYRILYTTDTFHPNVDGVVRALDLLIPRLEENGFEVHLLGPTTDHSRQRYYAYDGPQLPFYRDYRLVIPDFLRDIDVQLIHNHGLALTAIYGVVLGRRRKIPVLGHYHTDITNATHYIRIPKMIPELYVRLLMNRYDVSLAPSPMIERKLRRIGVNRIDILPVPVDTSRYLYSERKEGYLLHVGRLVKEKRIDMVFPYLEELNVTMYVAGKGPALDYYREIASRYRADIQFLGFVNENRLLELYRDARALVFSSDFDTLGLVCIEAMASGTPVIAHKDTAIADYLNPYGLVFHNRDTFLKSLRVADTIDRSTMRELAMRFDINNLLPKYIYLYRKFLNKQHDT